MAEHEFGAGAAAPSRTLAGTALCITMLIAAPACRATDLVDARPLPRTANPTALSSTDINRPTSYAIGDKLRITVFEQVHAGGPEGAERRDIIASAIERPEMSGEYIVQEDGNIYLPLTGAVPVAGTSFQDLDQALSATLSGRLSGTVRVGIQLKEREPVYVLGSVPRPGPYKHVPGMCVLHVLALAGAVDIAPQDQWRLLDTAREKERLLKSSERLTRSLARLAILVAERDGATPATKQLSQLVGATASEARLGEASGFRQVERSKREKQEGAIDAAAQAYQAELAIQRNKLTQVGSNLGDRTLRVDYLAKLRERGVTTDIIYYTSLTELGDAKERFQDARTAIAQTEHRISDLQHERARIAVDADVDREREIRELQHVIDEEELTRAAVGTALAQLPTSLERQTAGRKDTVLSIVRRARSGLERRPAQEDSGLEPGDVLQIVSTQADRIATR